jgi:hypothetical protein
MLGFGPKPKLDRASDGRPAVNALLWQRANETSADFVEQCIAGAMLFDRRDDLIRFALGRIGRDGLLIEVGVYQGRSINLIARLLSEAGDGRTVTGFDSFEGLSEDWLGNSHTKRGARFDLHGALPAVAGNVTLVKGWLDDTLPPFLQDHSQPIDFLHVDTDTYGPCKTTLSLCRSRLRPGSLVLFDEYLGYPGWQVGEHKALTEVFAPEAYRWIAFSGTRALMRVE